MPSPTGRRHPLFLRLQKPIDPIYPGAVTPIAWDDDQPIEEAEGVVYLATRPSPKLRAWAAHLRELHDADESYKTDDDISGLSGLSGQPIEPESLRDVGKWEHDLWNEGCGRVASARQAHFVCSSVQLLAVVLDRFDGQAVGFVAFGIKWVIEAVARRKGIYDLAIDYDQAWIAPAYRYRGWASTAAIGIAFATKRHVDHIEKTTRWPTGGRVDIRMTVGADIHSSSGERFLESCAQYMSFQFCLEKRHRIVVPKILVESRI